MKHTLAPVVIRRKAHKNRKTHSAHEEQLEYISELEHELRAPLTALRGLLEPLADGMIRDDETKQRYYRIMLTELARLQRLITDMGRLDRLQAKAAPETRAFDLSALISDTALSFSSQAAECGIEIETLAVGTPFNYALSDRDGIQQLLTVFLDNALRHSHNGGTVMITLKSSKDFKTTYKNTVSVNPPIRNNRLVLSVRDSGQGIAPEDLPHVFERFYKADRRSNDGTGLGLYIAERIAMRLNETILIESEPGAGTVVSFTLPPYIEDEQ